MYPIQSKMHFASLKTSLLNQNSGRLLGYSHVFLTARASIMFIKRDVYCSTEIAIFLCQCFAIHQGLNIDQTAILQQRRVKTARAQHYVINLQPLASLSMCYAYGRCRVQLVLHILITIYKRMINYYFYIIVRNRIILYIICVNDDIYIVI